MSMLNKGSIHSQSSSFTGTGWKHHLFTLRKRFPNATVHSKNEDLVKYSLKNYVWPNVHAVLFHTKTVIRKKSYDSFVWGAEQNEIENTTGLNQRLEYEDTDCPLSSCAEAEMDIRMREEFSKVCFETLLQFSFSNKVSTPQEGYISRMALSVLLQRAQDVLRRYVEDERLSGRCPLPRSANVNRLIFFLYFSKT